MVAENYSESRRAMAKQIGLGRKPKAADDAAPPPAPAQVEPAKPGRGRRKAAPADAPGE